MSIKVVFGVLFVLFAFTLMISDSLIHAGFAEKPSMVFTHAAHQGDHKDAGDAHGDSDAEEEAGGHGH